MNQVSVVGRLVRTPELRETENNNKVTYITVAVNRSFKNTNGEYETDFVDFILWNQNATNITTYCKKGDIIAVRGRIQSRVIEEDDKKKYVTDLVAEKISFLSSKKTD